MKKEGGFIFLLLVSTILMFGIVSAQENVSEEPPYDCSLILCQEGYYCDPYAGCISFEEPSSTTETNTTESVPTTEPEELEPEPESNTTGTGSVITGNAFLDYYFR